MSVHPWQFLRLRRLLGRSVVTRLWKAFCQLEEGCCDVRQACVDADPWLTSSAWQEKSEVELKSLATLIAVGCRLACSRIVR